MPLGDAGGFIYLQKNPLARRGSEGGKK